MLERDVEDKEPPLRAAKQTRVSEVSIAGGPRPRRLAAARDRDFLGVLAVLGTSRLRWELIDDFGVSEILLESFRK